MQKYLLLCAPWLFVILWGTGFVGAYGVAPYSEPFTILTIRLAVVIAIIMGLIWAIQGRAGFAISKNQQRLSMLVGFFMHGVYLSMVFISIKMGIHPAISALITSLHPIFTTLGGVVFLHERPSLKILIGSLLGFFGSIFALYFMHNWGEVDLSTQLIAIGLNIISALGASFGTIVQKRAGGEKTPFLAGLLWQYIAALSVVFFAAMLFESNQIIWHIQLILSLLWLIVGLSIGAVFLLMLLIRNHMVARASSVFYLVPAASAVEVSLIFGKNLPLLSLLGFAMAAMGVALVFYGTEIKHDNKK